MSLISVGNLLWSQSVLFVLKMISQLRTKHVSPYLIHQLLEMIHGIRILMLKWIPL